MNPAKMRDKMARKLVKHELDVDAYLADGGTLMDLGIIDSFGNIPPDDIKWKRVRGSSRFFSEFNAISMTNRVDRSGKGRQKNNCEPSGMNQRRRSIRRSSIQCPNHIQQSWCFRNRLHTRRAARTFRSGGGYSAYQLMGPLLPLLPRSSANGARAKRRKHDAR